MKDRGISDAIIMKRKLMGFFSPIFIFYIINDFIKRESNKFLLLILCVSFPITLQSADTLAYSKKIPTMYIETIDGNLNYVHQEKTNKVLATIVTIDTNGNVIYSGRCKFSGRGNSTWRAWPKRPYKLKFEQPQDILCLKDSSTIWCLLANYADNSQIRNALCYYIARQMGVSYTNNIYFVSLYINGEYFGLYNLATKQKFKTDVDSKVIAVFEKVVKNIYFKIPFDGVSSYDFVFRTKYGNTKEILNAINAFENVLYNDSSTYKDLLKYIDIESIARKNLVDLVTGNYDVSISQYYMLDDRHRISAINAWDYDISYGNQPENFDFQYNQIMTDNSWYNALFGFKEYREELLRLLQQNKKLLNEKTILFEDSVSNIIKEDLRKKANKWQVANSDKEKIDSFRVKRLEFLKRYIENPNKFRHIKFVPSSGKEYTICYLPSDTIIEDMLPKELLNMQGEDFGGWYTLDGTSIAEMDVINDDVEFYEKSEGTSGDPFDNSTVKYFLPLTVLLFLIMLLYFIFKGVFIPIKEG